MWLGILKAKSTMRSKFCDKIMLFFARVSERTEKMQTDAKYENNSRGGQRYKRINNNKQEKHESNGSIPPAWIGV